MLSSEKIHFYLNQALDWVMHFLPNFITAVLIMFIGWWLIGKIDKSIKVAMEKKNFEVSLTTFLRTLFSLGSKTILVIMVAGQIGFQTTSLAAMVGAVGLAVGLALQGSLANLAGGVLILLFKPYKVGDIINTGDYTGRVKEIQIFNTILLLGDNKTVILPNGSVSNSAIVNQNKQSHLVYKLKFTIPADIDHTIALPILENYLMQDENILRNSGIRFTISQLNDEKVHYTASLLCKPENYESVKEIAHAHLFDFYKKTGYKF